MGLTRSQKNRRAAKAIRTSGSRVERSRVLQAGGILRETSREDGGVRLVRILQVMKYRGRWTDKVKQSWIVAEGSDERPFGGTSDAEKFYKFRIRRIAEAADKLRRTERVGNSLIRRRKVSS